MGPSVAGDAAGAAESPVGKSRSSVAPNTMNSLLTRREVISLPPSPSAKTNKGPAMTGVRLQCAAMPTVAWCGAQHLDENSGLNYSIE